MNLGIARDTVESLTALLAGVRGADLLVTTGGASVGDYDLIKQVLGSEGLELSFYKIAMRPGKPLIFGRLGDVPVLGLPGNPVSTGVCSAIFLKPAMEKMLTIRAKDRPAQSAVLGRDLPENDKRAEYMRATLSFAPDGTRIATPFPKQDSAMLAKLSHADCLVLRPALAPPAKKGERVEILCEGPSRRNAEKLVGRTRTNKIVIFDGDRERLTGELFEVEIKQSTGHTLYGDAVLAV